MADMARFRALIENRIGELDNRVHEVEHELGEPKPADLNDQAIDLEDDEVLERLGTAAQREIALLHQALGRIEDGTFGICVECGGEISYARLEAVPYTPLCKSCAQSG